MMQIYFIDPGFRGTVWGPDGRTLGNIAKSDGWSVFALTKAAVFIIIDDHNGRPTDQVIRQVVEQHGSKRDIIFRDRTGEWLRLDHDDGKFLGFSVYRGRKPRRRL